MFGSDASFDERLRSFVPTAAHLVPSHSDIGFASEHPLQRTESKRTFPASRESARSNAPAKPARVDLGNYFVVPYRLFSSGLGGELGASAGWLYTALCSYANDNHSLNFAASDKALSCETGLSVRTICPAKKKLARSGLIEYSTEPGRNTLYALLKPDLERKKRKERPRLNCKPRGRKAKKPDYGYGDLPQILRGTSANFAHPYR